MNQGTILGSQIGRWIVLAAVVALLGALLLTIRPLGAQEAPPTIPGAETVFSYAEKGSGPVTTYRARDPEGNKIFWTLSGTDAGVFTIDGGALRFKSTPDYENPRDGAYDVNGDDNIDPDTEGAGNNIYRVTVRFGAGGEDGMPGTDHYDGDDLGELDLTITVTNVEEPGRVYISSLQPQIGTELTATITDQDGVAVTGSWQWASSDTENGTFTNIAERSGDRTYRPVDADLGKYLQVTVRYRDNVSGADIRELSAVSANPVRKDTVTSNEEPKFPDQRTLGLEPDVGADGEPATGNNAMYARLNTERFILENSPAGTKVGAPVTAFDDKSDIEVLTYSMTDTTAGSGHARSFNIDPVTGQITVAAGARLDAEAGADPASVDANHFATAAPFLVTVRATDGDGDVEDIAVSIKIVGVDEPPKIDRNYRAAVTHATFYDYFAGDRAPTEMSHYESDRTPRPARTIDADLDSTVINYTTDPPGLTGVMIQPATYTATDPEDANATLRWSLAGPDATRVNAAGDTVPVFVYQLTMNPDTLEPATQGTTTTGAMATLAFATQSVPDHENPWDTNKDNVYEVTLVVTDSVGNTNEYDVTVKVINSTDDNKPGKVTILNRQPEVARALTATFKDPDPGVSELKWQWYRSAQSGPNRTGCAEYDPHTPADDAAEAVRYFIDEFPTASPVAWVVIPGATSATYTPGYDEDSDGSVADPAANPQVWTGGDIDVSIAIADNGDKTYTWSNPKCLRATVTYRDDVDRTHAGENDRETTVDETLEATFKGSEFPVKPMDEENDAPVFTEGGTDTGTSVSTYTAERMENTTGDPRTINEAYPAIDVMTDEDDDSTLSPPGYGADILTYTLSGPDAAAFMITGTVDDVEDTDLHEAGEDGRLSFAEDYSPDAESKTRYTVTITATDPSGDDDFVNVTVNITDVNEKPDWAKGTSLARVVYAENGMADVDIYLADDPEGAGVRYSLVDDANVSTDIEADDIADVDKFSIDRLDGNLSFKSPPNYEKPGDDGPNNMYQIVVEAMVPADPTATPAGPHMIYRGVTVVVTNVNETPVFSDTTDTLEITENPDDPEKEPPSAAGYLYLLNRGVGKPAANLPAAPNLDVGIPVAASDDDSTGDFAIGGYTDTTTRDGVDGLTYTLSGTDAAHFHVVPATGQILTLEKLDYEAKKEYKVTVKATDPMGESDSIDMTIEVTDVDEVPVPRVLVISGDASPTYKENGTDDLGEYKVVAGGGAMVGAWSLDGTDASNFMLTGTGDSRMLKFASAPDYEDPMGGANDDSNTYDVTLKVTDSSESDVYGTFAVSVTVTNVDELGTLSGSTSVSVNEGDTDLGTYTLTGGPAAYTYSRSLEGDDAGQFTLNVIGTTGVLELSFSSAPDYEAPADADGDNTYEVTVKATAGGEETMVAVTVTVDDVDELGTLSGSTSASIMEGDTDSLGTYTLTGTAADTADWSLDGADMSDFMLEGTGMSRMLKFSSAPDFEAPMGGAANDSNTYMVTVMAKAGGEMEMVEVTITVDNVEEAGTVTLDPARPSVGTAITATLADDDIVKGTVMWQWASAEDGTFTNISDANSATYTPVDDDAGMYLRTTATYDDGYNDGNTAMMVTDTAVSQLAVNGLAEVEHTENVTNVAAYMASGADIVQWSLLGDDAGDFNINGGQLNFRSAPDYEDPADANIDNVYMVTVVATAGDLTDDQDVTVTVSNVDELGTLAGNGSLSYAEGGTAAVGTYMVSGGDGSTTINWSLDGADASQFMLDGTGMSRMLNFRSAPDYESPMGGANDDSNTYMVTVKAEAGGEMEMVEVTIMVTDVNEAGTVTLMPTSLVVGSEVTASLTDLDGGVTGTTWQWAKSMTMNGTFTDIGTATSASYTPVEDDAGMYLQATASYTDGHGTGKMATSEAVMVSADVVAGYDTNDVEGIQIDELFDAIDDYFAGGINISELFEVIDAYFVG